VLSFSVAGDGRSTCFLVAKKPGAALDLDVARAAVPLASLHGADPLPPYVRLIHDVLIGDRSLFTRPDGLAAVWQVAEPLLTGPPPPAGTRPAHGGQPKPASSSHPATGSWASNHPAPGTGRPAEPIPALCACASGHSWCAGLPVLDIAPGHARGEALARLFLAACLGLAVPVLGLGVATQAFKHANRAARFSGCWPR
jgi:Glucose-6-phosphate dehydrogenase, C-terminal domain